MLQPRAERAALMYRADADGGGHGGLDRVVRGHPQIPAKFYQLLHNKGRRSCTQHKTCYRPIVYFSNECKRERSLLYLGSPIMNESLKDDLLRGARRIARELYPADES